MSNNLVNVIFKRKVSLLFIGKEYPVEDLYKYNIIKGINGEDDQDYAPYAIGDKTTSSRGLSFISEENKRNAIEELKDDYLLVLSSLHIHSKLTGEIGVKLSTLRLTKNGMLLPKEQRENKYLLHFNFVNDEGVFTMNRKGGYNRNIHILEVGDKLVSTILEEDGVEYTRKVSPIPVYTKIWNYPVTI